MLKRKYFFEIAEKEDGIIEFVSARIFSSRSKNLYFGRNYKFYLLIQRRNNYASLQHND